MIRSLLTTISNRLPARAIYDNGEPYLHRFYVGTLFGRRYYLHEFVAGDPDRGLHNHPWKGAWSIILAGWYLEARRGLAGQERMLTVKWFNRLSADSAHRVILPLGSKPVWTLFSHTVGDIATWGFFRGSPFGQGEHAGTEVFEPFIYPGGKKDSRWWLSAPNGKQMRADRVAELLGQADAAFDIINDMFFDSSAHTPMRNHPEPIDNTMIAAGKTACMARQHSDQMVCKMCDQAWDMNDIDPPRCKVPRRK